MILERIPSGQPNLDLVLGGGLPRHSITLLAGAPGAGKTMLAQQYAFATGTLERPALSVTTVAEPLDTGDVSLGVPALATARARRPQDPVTLLPLPQRVGRDPGPAGQRSDVQGRSQGRRWIVRLLV